MTFARSAASALVLASLSALTFAQDAPADKTLEALKKLDDANREKYKGDPNVLVLPGLIADKAAKRVTLSAVATGLAADDPVEFWFTSLSSGKDYEALAVTPAMPSDVHKALEFIGLKPGRPVNYEKNQQWPRGPRVVVNFTFKDAQGADQTVRAEDLITVMPGRQSLARSGLMFVGSYTYKDDAGKEQYAADMLDSRAIAPNYNDPSAVLDVPQRSSQALVYGSQRGSDKHALPAGTAVRITLEPADRALADHTRDLAITASFADGRTQFTLAASSPATQPTTRPSPAHANIARLLAALADHADGKTDAYVTVRPDGRMPVTELRTLYKVLSGVESENGLRLDGPAEGDLYHRAFFPDETWRRREDRLGEPWELHLTRTGGKIAASLARMVDDPEAGRAEAQKEEKYDVASPEAFVELINQKQSQWTKVILVYPPGDLTYAELLAYVRPALATFPRVFVFTPEGDASTRPATRPAE